MFERSIPDFAWVDKKITKEGKKPVKLRPLYGSSHKLCVLIRQWTTSSWIAVVTLNAAFIVIKFRNNIGVVFQRTLTLTVIWFLIIFRFLLFRIGRNVSEPGPASIPRQV